MYFVVRHYDSLKINDRKLIYYIFHYYNIVTIIKVIHVKLYINI